MTPKLISEEFEREHREMYKWYRSQLPNPRLKESTRKPEPIGTVTGFILTEALDGERLYAKAHRIIRKNPRQQAQLVTVPYGTDDNAQFKLTYDGNQTDPIALDNMQESYVRTRIEAVAGTGNVAIIGATERTFIARFEGSLTGVNVPLMTAEASNLGTAIPVSVVKTPFNFESGEILVCEIMPRFRIEELAVGTVGLAVKSNAGWVVLTSDASFKTIILYGKADSNITAGSTGTVSIYAGTTDSGINRSCVNITDQQIDSGNWVEVTERMKADGTFDNIAKPMECPA